MIKCIKVRACTVYDQVFFSCERVWTFVRPISDWAEVNDELLQISIANWLVSIRYEVWCNVHMVQCFDQQSEAYEYFFFTSKTWQAITKQSSSSSLLTITWGNVIFSSLLKSNHYKRVLPNIESRPSHINTDLQIEKCCELPLKNKVSMRLFHIISLKIHKVIVKIPSEQLSIRFLFLCLEYMLHYDIHLNKCHFILPLTCVVPLQAHSDDKVNIFAV